MVFFAPTISMVLPGDYAYGVAVYLGEGNSRALIMSTSGSLRGADCSEDL